MRSKLDENLGQRGARLLRSRGHDVATVAEEELSACADAAVIEVCRSEGRCLVTLDLDFSNTVLFPPRRFQGIVVLRIPDRSGWADIEATLERLFSVLSDDEELAGRLLVVELHRVREYIDRRAEGDKE